MEEKDDFDFVPGLLFGEDEDELNENGPNKEEVVAGESKGDVMGEEEEDKKGCCEDTGLSFFEAEDEEFVEVFFDCCVSHVRVCCFLTYFSLILMPSILPLMPAFIHILPPLWKA